MSIFSAFQTPVQRASWSRLRVCKRAWSADAATRTIRVPAPACCRRPRRTSNLRRHEREREIYIYIYIYIYIERERERERERVDATPVSSRRARACVIRHSSDDILDEVGPLCISPHGFSLRVCVRVRVGSYETPNSRQLQFLLKL